MAGSRDVKQGEGKMRPLYGGGGKEQGEVLMGKRRMACQCQKWSCVEEKAGANEREDGRTA